MNSLVALGALILFSLLTDPTTLVATGDQAFFSIDYPSAVSAYESALRMEAANPEILWRLARVYVCMGEVSDESSRQPLFKQAESYARNCIRADSTKAEGHTWLAGALGYLALEEGMRQQVILTRELKAEVEKALTLNPNDDAALSIKGSMYRALGNVGWLQRQLATILFGGIPKGGFEEAEVALKKAIALAPDIMRHHYELAVLYLDWGREAEAKNVLDRAATLPICVAIDRERLVRIKQLLARFKDPQ
jgi:tetratricopeptide (TPR) repeat protein